MISSDEERIKVIRIIARLNIGGPAIQTILLTESLPARGFSTILIAGSIGAAEGDMTPLAIEKKIDLHIVSELGRELSIKSDIVALWKICKIIKKNRPHIVHTHTAKAGLLGRLAAFLLRVPIRVHTFHGHVFHSYFSPIKTKVFVSLERLLAKVTNAIISVSERQREELVRTYQIAPREHIQVIPLGFDLSPFQMVQPRLERKNLNVQKDTFTVGFIGRLVPIKNPFLFLEGINHYRHMQSSLHPDITKQNKSSSLRVTIVGEGELKDELQREIIKTGLQEIVEFLGWNREMAPIYARLDVLVLTSHNEGTPVVLIEAMASGKPFIATNVGGIRDLMVGKGQHIDNEDEGAFTVFENGILTEANDVKGIGSALVYMRANEERCCKMGQIGREFALQRFGKDRLVSDICSLYQKLLIANG